MLYDYVIAGGGSAGAVMAARLSEDPRVSVCLVEAGGHGRSIFVRAPALVAAMVSGRPRINNWALHTEPQPLLNGRRGFQPRGKALGGSSAINAMLYTRGHPADYDEWAALGADGWDWTSVLPYFRKAERNARLADALHGQEGPLQVRDQSAPRAMSRAFVTACSERQIPVTQDFNGARQDGAGLFQVTQFFDGPKTGERCSAAAAYLFPVRARPNLTVITGALADRVELDDGRAAALLVRRAGRVLRLQAKREVILSAGAFGSPAILMRSGIGPGDELARHGIPVALDLPGVGQNLQDHLDHIVGWRSPRRDGVALNPRGLWRLGRAAARWRRTGEGLFASPMAEAGAFLRSRPGVERPDLQLHFVIGILENHMRRLHFGDGFSLHVCVLRPESRGHVGLQHRDPSAPPRIDPGFLTDRRDLDLLIRGVRMAEDVLMAPALAPWRDRPVWPHDNSDAAITAQIRARADTIYHPVGTCRMGRDPMAVVAPDLTLHGVQGLRVVDASIMPRLVGGNTNAPTIMIAEKAAAMMSGH